jgi:hypothetical protein
MIGTELSAEFPSGLRVMFYSIIFFLYINLTILATLDTILATLDHIHGPSKHKVIGTMAYATP